MEVDQVKNDQPNEQKISKELIRKDKKWCLADPKMFWYNCKKIICVECWSTEGHKQHSMSVESLSESAHKQVLDWTEFRNKIFHKYDDYDEIYRIELSSSEVIKSVQDALKEKFRDIHRGIEFVKEIKLKEIEWGFSSWLKSDPNLDILRDTIDELKQLYSEVNDIVNKVIQKQNQRDLVGIVQMYYNISGFVERFQALNKITDDQIPAKTLNSHINVNEQMIKEALLKAVTIDSDMIKIKEEYRQYYFSKTKLRIHSVVSGKSESIDLQVLKFLPHKFSTIEANKNIFIIGGETLNSQENQFENSKRAFVIDENKNDITELSQMIFARRGHSLTVIYKESERDYPSQWIILATGSKCNDEVSKTTEFYDICKNEWNRGPNLVKSRYLHSSLLIDNRYVYLFWGRDPLKDWAINSIERFDVHSDSTTFEEVQFRAWPEWRNKDTVGTFSIGEGKILIFGGDMGLNSDSFIYDVNLQTIEYSSSMKKGEEFFNSHSVKPSEDKIYIAGGIDKDIHVYSISRNKWFLLEKEFIDW